ncbi:putative disease resistance protein [Fagus crenata]
MQRKLKSSEQHESSTSNKVRSLVPTGFTPSAAKFNIRMKFEIEKINRRAGAAGSRIIVTTHNASVGKVMGAVHSYNLDFISDKDCWAIFVQHALMNENVGISYFRLETKLEGNKRSKVSSKASHLSYVGSRYDATKKFEAISEFKHLRTFLPLMPPYLGYSYLSYDIILNLLPKLQNLRVLSLSGYRIVDLPDSIGDLKHLRYLDLSRTQLRSLPKSISTLYNLHTLLLEDCSSLNTLPADFSNLLVEAHFFSLR